MLRGRLEGDALEQEGPQNQGRVSANTRGMNGNIATASAAGNLIRCEVRKGTLLRWGGARSWEELHGCPEMPLNLVRVSWLWNLKVWLLCLVPDAAVSYSCLASCFTSLTLNHLSCYLGLAPAHLRRCSQTSLPLGPLPNTPCTHR